MRALLLGVLLCFGVTLAQAATEVKQVTSPKGLTVWYIEDHRLPIVSLAFGFRGGMSLDPAAKAGLAHFVSGVLDEGAGPRDSEAFQKAEADNSIALSFEATRDSFNGQMRVPSANLPVAEALLHDALTSPHLDPKDVERIRDQLSADLRQRMADPEWVAQRNFNNTVFHGHVYGQPGYGSLDTLKAITVDDLRSYVKLHCGRDQLVITATGDISPDALGSLADAVFGDLPAKAAPFAVPEEQLQYPGQVFVVEKPIPESVLLIGGPGPKRDDPDWYAAQILNYALGGGGFNSRLMTEIREKRALTYGIGSQFLAYKHAGALIISGSTKNEDAATALKLVRDEVGRMQATGVTDAELADAKTYLTGSLPLQMTSTLKVADIMLSMRLDDLPIDFLQQRDKLYNRVTAADVARVAKRFLDPAKQTAIVLGKPAGVTSTAPLPN